MKGAWRVLRRDFSALLYTPWTYAVAAGFLALTGLTFFIAADATREATLRFWLPNLSFVLLVSVPVITSRSLAEERRTRHLDALLARPISPLGLVVGKWLAACALFIMFILPTLVYVGFLAAWGRPDWPPLITSYLGAILALMMFSAIGTLTSSVAPTATVAGVSSFALIVTLQLADAVSGFRSFSFVERLNDFAQGVPRLSGVVYFLSGTALSLILAAYWQVVHRTAVRLRRALVPATLALTTVAANFAVLPVDKPFDVSAEGQHTLAPASRDVLRNLTQPIRITVFQPANSGYAQDARLFLREVHTAQPKVSYRVMDRRRYEAEALRLGVTTDGQAVIELGDRHELVDPATELEIMSAVQRLVRNHPQTVCALTGHGERFLDDDGPFGLTRAHGAIQENGLAVKPLDLTVAPVIPPECTVIAVFGPQVPLRQPEIDALRGYLDANGKMLLLRDPGGADVDALTTFLGLRLLPGVVFDPQKSVANDPTALVLDRFPAESPTVKDVPSAFAVAAGGITTAASADKGLTVARVLESSDTSWLSLDPSSAHYVPARGDRGGPVVVAAAADRSRLTSSGETRVASGGPAIDRTRLFVMADVDWVSNQFLDELGNRKLLGNAINWLAGEENLVAVGGEKVVLRRLVLTGPRRKLMGWVSIGGLPGIALVMAGVLWVVRRRR